jgi:cellulose synthase/poly-beta-1,6-N-acetylglucosamine synthase-like glycosyltransferase
VIDLRLVLLIGVLAALLTTLRSTPPPRARGRRAALRPVGGGGDVPSVKAGGPAAAEFRGATPEVSTVTSPAPRSGVTSPPPLPTLIFEPHASRPDAPVRPKTPRVDREHPSVEQREALLDEAVNGLRKRTPAFSAFTTFTKPQLFAVGAVCVVCLLAAVLNVKDLAIAFVALCALVYLSAIIFRLRLLYLARAGLAVMSVTDEEALSVPEPELPTYTVIVPAYHEPAVLQRLISSVGAFDYPRHLLDVKLLLEEDDRETVDAVREAAGAENVDVILVPAAQPRTKPKALNYGLQFATGDLLTIYDAEDRPEPLQLRRAAIAMATARPDIACIQAQLAYFNPSQNIITKWFTVEYLMWFTQMLPGLSAIDAPVPLGGTSNHFRCDVLKELGGWDPFNVTEDADLGVRLHRLGYRTGILESTTYEEANSDFVNWERQRSRWYKGYLQTWLVHLRDPKSLYKDLGAKGFARFNLFVGGTPIIAVLNPIFWAMTVLWFIGHPLSIRAIFPAAVYYVSLACWLLGNFLFLYLNVMVVVDAKRDELVLAAILSPIYWVMMSIAAVKALYQLLAQPSYWEKTFHGLDSAKATDPVPALET